MSVFVTSWGPHGSFLSPCNKTVSCFLLSFGIVRWYNWCSRPVDVRLQRSLGTELCHRVTVVIISRQPEESWYFLMLPACWNPGVSIRWLNKYVTGVTDYIIQKRGITSNSNHNWSQHLHKLAISPPPFFKTHPYSMQAKWARWRNIYMLNFP